MSLSSLSPVWRRDSSSAVRSVKRHQARFELNSSSDAELRQTRHQRPISKHLVRFEFGNELCHTRHQRPISTHLVRFELGEGLCQQLLEGLHLELHNLALRPQARFELGNELRHTRHPMRFELHNLDLTHALRDAEHAVHLAERLIEQPALLVSDVCISLALMRVKRRLCMQ